MALVRLEAKGLHQQGCLGYLRARSARTDPSKSLRYDQTNARFSKLTARPQAMKHSSTAIQNRSPNSELAFMSSGRRGLGLLLQNCNEGFRRPSVKTNRSSSPVLLRKISMNSENSKSSANSITTNTTRRYRARNPRQAYPTVHADEHPAGWRPTLPLFRTTVQVFLCAALFCVLLAGGNVFADPALPEVAGTISIPAQEWPFKPGQREIAVHVHYPGSGSPLGNVNAGTGVMLSLHNWGGSGSAGSADPRVLADEFNVIAVGVDYLQSGLQAALKDPEPYDFGWLQALDVLRALQFVTSDLQRRGIAFDSARIFTTGGSGGGNVSLMANKLAPRTFAAVIDMCGMKKLTDDIAYNLPGGSKLNARYIRDPRHPYYLSTDRQELHDLGNAEHLAIMRGAGCNAKIITVHGEDDQTDGIADKYAASMTASGLDFTYVRVTKEMIDGSTFTTTGHALGNRTAIVRQVAGDLLKTMRRQGPSDFERREDICYPTTNGVWTVSYARGWPEGRFESR